MSSKKLTKQQARIREILNRAESELKAEGLPFILAVIDKNPKARDGGKVLIAADKMGEHDFKYMLDAVFPLPQDVINLGIWVGHLLFARNKVKK